MADEGLTAEELVQACNTIIVYAGLIAKIATIEDVRVVCSSTGLLVAALEGIIQQRLEDVIRNPSTPAERAYNNNLVVELLSKLLGTDLSHISGERIVEGFLEDISNLLELLAALCQGRPLLGPPLPELEGALQDETLDADGEDEYAALREDAGTEEYVAGAPEPQLGFMASSDEEDTGSPGDDEGAVDDFEAAYCTQTVFPEPQTGQSPNSYEDQKDKGCRTDTREVEQHGSSSPLSEQQRGYKDMICPPEEQKFVLSGDLANDASGLRRRARRRRMRTQQEPAPQRPGPNAISPLSPIQELSREGRESVLHSQGATPRIPGEGVVSAPANGRPGQSVLLVKRYNVSSSGGSSSVISIPTDLADTRRTAPQHEASDEHLSPQELRAETSETAYVVDALGDSSSPPSDDTVRMLANALSQTQATLRELAREHRDFYGGGHSLDAKSWGAMLDGPRQQSKEPVTSSSMSAGRSRSGGRAASSGTRHAAWGDPAQGGQAGSLKQQQAFIRQAMRALMRDDSAGAGASVSMQSDLPKPKSAARAAKGTKGPGAAGKAKSKHAAAARPASRNAARDQDTGRRSKDRKAKLLQPLKESPRAQRSGAVRDGRDMLQNIAASYGSALSLPSKEHGKRTGARGALNRSKPAVAQPNPAMRLCVDLEAKLKYVCRLANGDPKQRAAREAVKRVALSEEYVRQTRRRELVERLSSARARRDATLQMTTHRLRELSEEHERRVEQLRLQRLASEWCAKQRGAQMRRALEAELALRDAFLEVLQREKEVLLEQRKKNKAYEDIPLYKSAMRKADQESQHITQLLEDMLAAERQQRILACREAQLAQRQGKELAAAVVHDHIQELLCRVAREEEAVVARHSLASQPQGKQHLVAQMRRLMKLS